MGCTFESPLRIQQTYAINTKFGKDMDFDVFFQGIKKLREYLSDFTDLSSVMLLYNNKNSDSDIISNLSLDLSFYQNKFWHGFDF